jgi:uncharacterized RDD family membrane protein YckC
MELGREIIISVWILIGRKALDILTLWFHPRYRSVEVTFVAFAVVRESSHLERREDHKRQPQCQTHGPSRGEPTGR